MTPARNPMSGIQQADPFATDTCPGLVKARVQLPKESAQVQPQAIRSLSLSTLEIRACYSFRLLCSSLHACSSVCQLAKQGCLLAAVYLSHFAQLSWVKLAYGQYFGILKMFKDHSSHLRAWKCLKSR